MKFKKNIIRIISNNFLMLKYIFKYVPGLVIFRILQMIMTSFSQVLSTVYAAKYVIDAVQFYDEHTPLRILRFLVLIIALNILVVLITSFYDEIYFPKKKELLLQKMHTELFVKAKDMDLACYDNPKFYNDFVWATSQADEQALSVLESVGYLTKNVTSILSVGAIIVSIDTLGLLFAALSVGIDFFTQIKENKVEYQLEVERKPLQRKRDYVSRVLYMPDYAKEIRLSNVEYKLIKNFKEANSELIATIKKYSKQIMKWRLINWNIAWTFMLNGVYMMYLLYKTIVLDIFSYGGFIALYKGVEDLQDNLFGIAFNLSNFQRHSLYIERFVEFINYKPKVTEKVNALPMPGHPAVMQLKNVSFTYDGTETPTLKNINLEIKPKEKIALVGYNGAGKSTLIKLIMRLYDTSDGNIHLNDVDIRDYKLTDYRNNFGVVFQDYQLFAATIAENVIMDEVKERHEPEIYSALAHSGFKEKLNTLEDGIATPLTREFSKKGVNLSGGEAQKVAIARVFPGHCNIIILDEPSSSLDPISEYNVNQSMLEAAMDKTVIFISHRLSTTKIADRIIMLEKGEIIEEGNHEDLMALNGKYAEMFNMQAEKYKTA